jgi:drug/metabolite transporter (DMT)-like permease
MISVWVAIALTVLATLSTKIGLVLLKRGIDTRHALIWYLAVAMLVGGMGIYLAANSIRAAPISLLQPIYASGWLVLAVLAVSFLHERFRVVEWLGLLLLFAGILLLAASVENNQASHAGVDLPRLRIYLAVAIAVNVVVLLILRNCQTLANREVLFGLLAGLLLGVGYLSVKVCPLGWADGRPRIVLLGLGGMGIGLIGGLYVTQWGYHHGRALIVSSVNLVINQIMVIIGGIWCLGERLPEQEIPFYARLIGFVAVLTGTVMLGCRRSSMEARSSEASAATAKWSVVSTP